MREKMSDRELPELECITLRAALPSDCEDLYIWRNHPAVRAYANQPQEIDWSGHTAWFQSVLLDKNRALLVAETDSIEPLGVLRYDWQNPQEAVVSVYLVPAQLRRGYGCPLLQAGHQWIQAQHSHTHKILAEIAPENIASIKVFEKAGYQLASAITSERGTRWYEYALS